MDGTTFPAGDTTYQLLIRIDRDIRIRIGALGKQDFPAGNYFYFVIFPTPAGGKQPRRPVFVGVVHE